MALMLWLNKEQGRTTTHEKNQISDRDRKTQVAQGLRFSAVL